MSVSKNATMEVQAGRLTDDIAALQALDTGAASDNRLTAQLGEMEQECTKLKACIATADELVVQLLEQNVCLFTSVDNLNTTFEKGISAVERINDAFTAVRNELTTVRSGAVRNSDVLEVQQLVTDAANMLRMLMWTARCPFRFVNSSLIASDLLS